MKLVRFLKPMPEHSANIGDEMGFSDEKAAEFVAKGRAMFVAAPAVVGAVVDLEAKPEIVGKIRASPSEPTFDSGDVEEQVPAALGGDDELVSRTFGADEIVQLPERRGPGRPRKNF